MSETILETPTPSSDIVIDTIESPLLENVSIETPAIEEPLLENVSLETLTVEEPRLENVSIETNNHIVEKTFLDIVKTSLQNLASKDASVKPQIFIVPELTNIIEKIVTRSPDIFNEMEQAILEIIQDNKIDSKDIPQFIVVVQKMYQIIYSLKAVKIDTKKRSETTCSVLKYIVHLLVLERKIMIDQDKQADFLTECDALIDSCTGLLSFSKTIRTKSCLQKLFS